MRKSTNRQKGWIQKKKKNKNKVPFSSDSEALDIREVKMNETTGRKGRKCLAVILCIRQ